VANILKSAAGRLAHWLSDLSPSCREATRLAALAVNNSLPWRQRIGLRVHVLLCHHCRRFERQLHILRQNMAHYAGESLAGMEVRLSDASRERLKETLSRSNKG